MKKKFSIICPECKSLFFTNMSYKIYCSSECRYKNRCITQGKLSHLKVGDVGALGEMFTCSNLIFKGYEVYRAISQASKYDLIALKNGKIMSIQVRTGYRGKDNRVFFPKKKTDKHPDHYAIVLNATKEVVYLPELV
jgi:hypothetical protein